MQWGYWNRACESVRRKNAKVSHGIFRRRNPTSLGGTEPESASYESDSSAVGSIDDGSTSSEIACTNCPPLWYRPSLVKRHHVSRTITDSRHPEAASNVQ